MSIVNLWCDSANVLIAVDSRGKTPDGVENEFVKLVAVPHARSVLAMRGERALFGMVLVPVLCDGAYACSYDEIVEMMPTHMMALSGLPMPPGLPERSHVLELFVAGWSDSQQRMAACRFLCRSGEAPEEEDLTGFDAYITPPGDEAMQVEGSLLPCGEHEAGGFEAALLAFMTRQAAQGRDEFPGLAFGGRVLLARLDRGGVSVDEIGEIP